MTDSMARLLICVDYAALLVSLVLAMAARVQTIGPDRAFPRKIKQTKVQGFFPNYKHCR